MTNRRHSKTRAVEATSGTLEVLRAASTSSGRSTESCRGDRKKSGSLRAERPGLSGMSDGLLRARLPLPPRNRFEDAWWNGSDETFDDGLRR